MKKFSRKLIWFLAALPLVWVAFIFFAVNLLDYEYRKNALYTWSGYGFTNTRLKEADTVKNVDVLILGSSHAYRGFDVRIFAKHGIRAFNLGSSSQSPLQSEYLIKKYIGKIRPRLLLMEVGYMSLTTDGVEGGIDIVSNVTAIDRELFKMAAKINNLSLYNTLAYSTLDQLINNDRGRTTERLINTKDIYVPGGYVEHKVFNSKGPMSFKRRSVRPNLDQKKALERIMVHCKKNGIPVILVQAPVVYDEYSAITNQNEFEDYLKKSGALYFNFNSPKYTQSLFYDHHHLNQRGVEVFNRELMIILKKEFKK